MSGQPVPGRQASFARISSVDEAPELLLGSFATMEKIGSALADQGEKNMNCTVCGSPIPAGEQFCPACGTHVPASAQNGQSWQQGYGNTQGQNGAGGYQGGYQAGGYQQSYGQNYGGFQSAGFGAGTQYRTWVKVIAWIAGILNLAGGVLYLLMLIPGLPLDFLHPETLDLPMLLLAAAASLLAFAGYLMIAIHKGSWKAALGLVFAGAVLGLVFNLMTCLDKGTAAIVIAVVSSVVAAAVPGVFWYCIASRKAYK